MLVRQSRTTSAMEDELMGHSRLPSCSKPSYFPSVSPASSPPAANSSLADPTSRTPLPKNVPIHRPKRQCHPLQLPVDRTTLRNPPTKNMAPNSISTS